MILVVGATGSIGSQAVKELVGAGLPVRAMSRDPSRLPALGANMTAVQGDLDRPETVGFALKGVDQVLLAAGTGNQPAHEANVIRQAEEAGVHHLVLVSSLGVEYGVGSGPAHKPGEDVLRSSGLSWTILRGGPYMTNALRWSDTIRSDGAFYEPTGDGKYALIDPRDIGAVAARVMSAGDPDRENQVLELTGPEALSSAEYADKLSVAVGRPIRHVDIPADAFRDAMLKAGVPPVVLEPVTGFYAMVKAGQLTMVTPGVEQVLGAPARTFDAWAEDNAPAFR
jgi:(4-alkanoyl-5-oxo-2,5-dihydrofuran-3-yl)methyl phosphate reductase